MGIPIVYRNQGNILGSYSFTDLVSKTGFLTFYVVGDTAGALTLTPVIIESDFVTTDRTSTGTTELDIDVTFKTNQILEGTLYVAISEYATSQNGVGGCTVTPKVRIYHVSNAAVETEIGAQQTLSGVTRAASTGTNYIREMALFSITRKGFSIGEKLRLNIEVTTSNGTNSNAGIYHDGANRDVSGSTLYGEALPTDIKCIVPFVVDV